MGPVKLKVTNCARTFCLSLDNLSENFCSLQYSSCVQRAHGRAWKVSPSCSDRRFPLCPTFVLPLHTHLWALSYTLSYYVLHDASYTFSELSVRRRRIETIQFINHGPSESPAPPHNSWGECHIHKVCWKWEPPHRGFQTKTKSILKPYRASSRFLKMFLTPLQP